MASKPAAFDQDPALTPSPDRWSVEYVLSTLPTPTPRANSTSPVPFFHILERLKLTKREGWRRFGIKDGESISDHMYRMSILTMFAPPSLSSRLNVPHCTKMALVHDMAESLVGDITPVDGVKKEEKSRREAMTINYLTGTLLGNVAGDEGRRLKEIWEEYEANETLEAKFVHDIDKMELVLQMMEYERARKGEIDLGEFSWVAERIVLPEVKQWCEEVLQERAAFWASLGKKIERPKTLIEEIPTSIEQQQGRQKNEHYGRGDGTQTGV